MNLFLTQMAVVLIVALICGSLALRFGQARVIGEIVGGILIGPSVFGRFAPHLASQLFPLNSLGPFEVLSNVGLILFLFLVGTEFNFAHLRGQGASATLTSSLSIGLPFGLAAMCAHAIRPRFAPANVGSVPFALFLGVSMSITAFPVLARILEERRLQSTAIGTTALMCAAVDDVAAWMLLATALTFLPHRTASMPIGISLLWLAVYVIGMLFLVRPLAGRLTRPLTARPLTHAAFGLILAMVLLSAAATDIIGVHPLFGAFLAGVCFPRIPAWQRELRARLDLLVSALLLPFFFALTGMRTRLDLLNGGAVWLWTAVILLIAIAGKLGGATVAARLTGMRWRDSLGLGALLNTRGLVELIVLNIAYNAHVFSPTLFTMLVVMALLTTMMTTPLLNMLRITGTPAQEPNPQAQLTVA